MKMTSTSLLKKHPQVHQKLDSNLETCHLDSAKAATTYAISSVPPLTTYFQTLHTALQFKCPPKPRYTTMAHTKNDGTDWVCRKCTHRHQAGKYQITQFFTRRAKQIELLQPVPV
jgi:hypothetical protein